MVFPHQRHSVPTIFEQSKPDESIVEGVGERQTMSAQELRVVALYLGQRGLMIWRMILESLSQVMDQVQIQQLLLFAQVNHMEMAKESDGVGTLEGTILAEEVAESVLAEDQGEVHNFEGNNNQ